MNFFRIITVTMYFTKKKKKLKKMKARGMGAKKEFQKERG
jgi:hypothetical protein